MTDPQEVTTGGEPIVRTSVRPQAEVSPPPVVTPDAAAGDGGTHSVVTPAAAPFTCRVRRCATYAAIVVEDPQHGAHRVTFHGDLVGVYPAWEAALVVTGLHAGAHLEASRWRWSQPTVREEPCE